MSQTLAEYLQRHRKLSWRQAVELLSRVAAALESAPRGGIEPEALTPYSILYNPKTKSVQLRNGAELESSKVLPYTAPELLRGDPRDQIADVWALAVLLYEMLSGDLPFYTSDPELLEYQINNELPALLPSALKVPAGLSLVLAKALHKDREQRYHTVAEFMNALTSLRLRSYPLLRPVRRQVNSLVRSGLILAAVLALGWGLFLAAPHLVSAMKSVTILSPGGGTPSLQVLAASPSASELTKTVLPTLQESTSLVDTADASTGVVYEAAEKTPTPSPTAPLKTAVPTPTLRLPTKTPTPTFTPTTPPLPPAPPPKPISGREPAAPTSATPQYSITLLEPQEGFAGDEVTLKWQSDPLTEGLAFEPVVWKTGRSTDMKAHGMSPTGVTLENSVTARMSILEGVGPLKMQRGKDYFWGVCIAQNEPYQRLWCTNGRRFHYDRSDKGGGSGGGRIDE